MRAIGIVMATVGFALTSGAVLWFQSFYKEAAEFVGGKDAPLPVECLYSMTGPCRSVAAVISWTGSRPYEPLLFWCGISSLFAGIMLQQSSLWGRSGNRASRQGLRHEETQLKPNHVEISRDRIEPSFDHNEFSARRGL